MSIDLFFFCLAYLEKTKQIVNKETQQQKVPPSPPAKDNLNGIELNNNDQQAPLEAHIHGMRHEQGTKT
jgi:hypothetical protein